MVDRSPDADSGERTDGYAGTPGWVKGFGIIAGIVLLLVAFVLFSGLGGQHGPERHGASAEPEVSRTGITRQIRVV